MGGRGYSRRDFLKTVGAAAGAAALSGCARSLGFTGEGRGVVSAPSLMPSPTGTATSLPDPAGMATATTAPTNTPVQAINTLTIPSPIATPDPRKLCFVLWDHQLARYGYRPRNLYKPVPETCPLFSGARNRLDDDWIEYWQGILKLLNPGMDSDEFRKRFGGLVADARAFTNDSGPESGNFALHSITCGGATHEMVTGEREDDLMEIYTLNVHDGPPPIPSDPHEIDMTRHFFATTGSNVKLPDGTYAVYGFPQFENCIVPLLSQENTDHIEVSRIMTTTRMRSPYNLGPQECYPPFGCPTPAVSPTQMP